MHRGSCAGELWKNEDYQVRLGWLSRHRLLNQDGCFSDSPKYQLNIAFRFDDKQADKIRACDDLRNSHASLGDMVGSPITLPTWGVTAQQRYILADRPPRYWGLASNSRESAYKRHPVLPAHSDLAAAAIRSPDGGKLYGFTPRTQLFGSVASVLRYNVFSRLLFAIANRLLGIPAIGYVGDFAFHFPSSSSLGEGAMAISPHLTDIICIKLKKRKFPPSTRPLLSWR